jgi:hypothetical protein
MHVGELIASLNTATNEQSGQISCLKPVLPSTVHEFALKPSGNQQDRASERLFLLKEGHCLEQEYACRFSSRA